MGHRRRMAPASYDDRTSMSCRMRLRCDFANLKFCRSLHAGTSAAFSFRRQPGSGRLNTLAVCRGVATAEDTGDASPCALPCPPYIKMTTDSLSSELTFDE